MWSRRAKNLEAGGCLTFGTSSIVSSASAHVTASGPPANWQTRSLVRYLRPPGVCEATAARLACLFSRGAYLSDASLRLVPSTGMPTRASASRASTSRSTNSASGYTPDKSGHRR